MRRWLPFTFFFLFVAFIVYVADTRLYPGFFHWVNSVAGMDKAGHFVLMGTLAWCANHGLAWRRLRVGPLAFLVGSFVITVLVALEEGSQHWFPSRTWDWRDLVADLAGIWLAGRLGPRAA